MFHGGKCCDVKQREKEGTNFLLVHHERSWICDTCTPQALLCRKPGTGNAGIRKMDGDGYMATKMHAVAREKDT